MLKLPNFTKSTLLVSFFLLLTGCNDNATTVVETNLTASTQSSQVTSMQENTNGLKNLMLTIDKTILNKDENTTLKVMATYEDGTSKEVTDKVKWIVTPESSVIVTQKILIAKKDNPTILKAKLGNILSNSISLDITWIVNDYTLPPEPDKTLNDSTLLGIDVNGNGVRDDVERWIYEKYKDKHPIHIDIAMQAGRAYKLVLETPERAKEIHDEVSAPSYCESYYKIYAKYFNESTLVNNDITNEYFRTSIMFNTQERKMIYLKYDKLLSGDSYSTPKIGEGKQFCDFNTTKYEE
jgi:hypothetical protein